jgi:hypothetical protein
VFYFTQAASPQSMQEIVNIIRAMTDIQQASRDNAQRTLALRGTADQIALAEWLFNKLDQPASGQAPAQQTEYRLPDGRNEVVSVFYLTLTQSPQGIQEIVNVIRAIADLQRVFPHNAQRTLALRGTADQIRLAEWLCHGVDKPVGGQAPPQPVEYRLPGGNEVVRVFYLTQTASPQRLQEIVNTVRTTTKLQRVFPCGTQKALAVRGTDNQIAAAERLVQELDKP